MTLSNLDPVTREETILNGDEITPASRSEYFLQKAVNKVPKPGGVSDAGKVVTVNETGDGYALAAGGGVDVAVFNILADDQTGDLYLEDSKTINDIDVAYRAGKQIVMKYFGLPFAFVYYATETGHFEGGNFFNALPVMNPDGVTLDSLDFEIVMMDGSGALSIQNISIPAGQSN